MLGEGSNWDIAVAWARKERGRNSINWCIHIALPNIIKFLEGILVMVVSWMIIVQSDNIIDLLKVRMKWVSYLSVYTTIEILT